MALFGNIFGKKKIINPQVVTANQPKPVQENTASQDKVQENAQENPVQDTPKLIDDILVAADWVLNALNSSGYKVDYAIESMKEMDRFFDEQSVPGGLLASERRGNILFSIGSLMGQIAIQNFGGKWITDDADPRGEINIEVELNNGTHIWPVQRAMKRLMNGPEDGIYEYMCVLDPNAGSMEL